MGGGDGERRCGMRTSHLAGARYGGDAWCQARVCVELGRGCAQEECRGAVKLGRGLGRMGRGYGGAAVEGGEWDGQRLALCTGRRGVVGEGLALACWRCGGAVRLTFEGCCGFYSGEAVARPWPWRWPRR